MFYKKVRGNAWPNEITITKKNYFKSELKRLIPNVSCIA